MHPIQQIKLFIIPVGGKDFVHILLDSLGTKKTIIVLSNMSNQSVFGTKELIKLFD